MNSKLIVKNTVYLYLRMLLSSFIGLFSSRIILKQLGVVDYGIYNVVFGMVVLMGFMVSAMTVSVQRYLSYQRGLNNTKEVEKVLNISVVIHIGIAMIVLILAETLGLLIFNNILNIPDDRIDTAKIVYQFSIFVFMISIIRSPFEALLNSCERFGTIAFLGVLESAMRLGAAYILIIVSMDKLFTYSMNIMIISGLFFILYSYLSLRKLPIRLHFNYPLNQYKELLSFSGWNLLGGTANMLKSQGSTILINYFFGPIVNASQGVANQVLGIVNTLSANVTKAVNPQIVQSYAKNDMDDVTTITQFSGKITSYLLIFAIIPLILFTKPILVIWLGDYPMYAPIMIRLVLILTFFENLSNPIMIVYQSYGKIKKYQLIMSSIIMLYIPITIIVFHITHIPYLCYAVSIFLSIILLFSRLFMAGKYANYQSKNYFYKVVVIVITTFIISISIAYLLKHYLHIDNVILGLITTTIVSMITIWAIGINKKEKKLIINYINKIKS